MKYGPSDAIFIIVTIVTFFVSGLDKKTRFRKRTGANLTKNFEFSYFQSKF